VNDLEHDLSARLRELADELTGPAPALEPQDAVTRYRHRRRARAGLVATVAAVVAIAVGVPTAIGSLSSQPVQPAAPAVSSTGPTGTAAADDDRANPEAVAAAESARAVAEAADAAAQAAAQPGLDALVAELGDPVRLSSPAEWDRWLPEGKPFPGVDLADDLSTCPVLSDRLRAVAGQEMSYWTGTLPNGPAGCTWVETPLDYDTPDYQHVISVGFLADGTSVDSYRRAAREGGGQGTNRCPSADLAGGGALLRCTSPGTTGYTLLLPDERLEGGLWVLGVSTQDGRTVPPEEILPVLVEGAVAAFG
jgi:hypothetical protein